MNRKLAALLVPIFVVTLLDQWTKYLVRTTPSMQDWTIIPGWLSFHYTQNPGMALGLDWLQTPVISMVSIVATIGIFIYVVRLLHTANVPFLIFMGLVIGGALGNIIDRLIMGYIERTGGLLDGHVVDFIHFTLNIGGYPVFPYIFNVADMAISTSLVVLILFNKYILPSEELSNSEDNVEENSSDSNNSNKAVEA